MLDARHDHLGYSARDDEIEVGEIGRNVEREPVPSHPLLHVNPYAGNLPVARPHTCITFSPRGSDAEFLQRPDDAVFQSAQEPVQILSVLCEIEDRVPDELAGSMKRDVATPFDLEHVDPSGCESFAGRRQVFDLEGAA